MKECTKEYYEKLNEELKYYSYCYYVMDDSVVPDSYYDEKYQELKSIEDENPGWILPNSVTQRVGGYFTTKEKIIFNKKYNKTIIL